MRKCTHCGKLMTEGFYCEDGTYYCSQECLDAEVTPEEWAELYADGEGDSYYTEWELDDVDFNDFTLAEIDQMITDEYYTEADIVAHYNNEWWRDCHGDKAFKAMGVYSVSNAISYEVEYNSEGTEARLRNGDEISVWVEIEYLAGPSEDDADNCGIIPLWGGVPIAHVMRVK